MLPQRFVSALVGLALLGSLGCCHRGPWPCGNTYCGSQCGCLFWHEWFSHKPLCCDPCDGCGNFTRSRNPYVVTGPRYTRFGEVYGDGSGSNAPGAIGQMYPGSGEPTPARSGQGVLEDAGPREMGPTPAAPRQTEELPGPTTYMPGRGYGRMATRPGSVDSPWPGRTLGGSSRTRLFSR